jgi:acetyl esterase/lipase
MLEHRVFLPPGARSQSPSNTTYPLLISIHGGGFAICDPQGDDHVNRVFSEEHDFVVVSINYRLAPRNPFPDGVHDVGEVIRAVLADSDLPVDHSKVAIMGFSAGGNLTLAVAQLPGIREKVQSLVPFYPVTDFSSVYKREYKTTPDGKDDMLKDLAPLIDWAYINPGQDKTDPLLSPIYASREQLPQRIFFICAEHDCLCYEANIMATKLAGQEADLGSDWEKNGIKWRMVPQTHAWTHMPKAGEAGIQEQKELRILYAEIAEWLRR